MVLACRCLERKKGKETKTSKHTHLYHNIFDPVKNKSACAIFRDIEKNFTHEKYFSIILLFWIRLKLKQTSPA